jgi:UDP-2-acetamido-3-amino-2,3-dideoxy-glucuronate N-acetyltransferase
VNKAMNDRAYRPGACIVVDNAGTEVGDSTIWNYVHIGRGAKIGDGCTLGDAVHIGPKVKIGNGCKIQNGAQLFEGVTLEDDVFVGPHVVTTNVTIPRAFINRHTEFKTTLIKRGASIGANATIICGITIGEYAMIGAGAVVTKSVSPHTLVLGAPAQFNWHVCRCGGRLWQTYGPDVRKSAEARFACTVCPLRYLRTVSDEWLDVEGPPDAAP